MTAHDLARKLLEGPNLPVVTIDYYGSEAEEVAKVEPLDTWQVDYGGGGGWESELKLEEPRNKDLKQRLVKTVRVI